MEDPKTETVSTDVSQSSEQEQSADQSTGGSTEPERRPAYGPGSITDGASYSDASALAAHDALQERGPGRATLNPSQRLDDQAGEIAELRHQLEQLRDDLAEAKAAGESQRRQLDAYTESRPGAEISELRKELTGLRDYLRTYYRDI